MILQAHPVTYHNSLSHSKLPHDSSLCGPDCTRWLKFGIVSKWPLQVAMLCLPAAKSTGIRWFPQGRAVPGALRVSEHIRNGWVLVPSGGALGTAPPTFKRAGNSG